MSERLTLNLGVRYDLELGMTEAREPQHARLRLTWASPIQAAAAARRDSPPAGVPLTAAQFGARLVGGYAYLSDDKTRVWNADKNNIQPPSASRSGSTTG